MINSSSYALGFVIYHTNPERIYVSDYKRAITFNGCYRLMDDISSINSDGVFEEATPFIYPESLTLNKENEGNISANILDLNIELDVSSNNLVTGPYYYKRDKFKFLVVNYPDMCGTI